MSKPEILLVDIDGTVADCEHRRKYIDDVIRVGDTVYMVGMQNAKKNPILITKSDGASIPYLEDAGGVLYVANDEFDPSYGKRIKVRKKKDYKRFFESCKDDSPIQTTIDIVRVLSRMYPVVFCSGRPENYREPTARWLNLNGLWYPNEKQMFMRPSGDQRQDYIVKEELYRKHIEPFYIVKCVFDDRAQVVSMWRRLGLTCYAVAEGDF